MHKKKAPHTKILVRNPEKPKPKTTLVNHYALKPQVEKKTDKESARSSENGSKIRFKSPEPNSALILARKIESIENLKPRKVKSVSSLSAEKLAIDEKVGKFCFIFFKCFLLFNCVLGDKTYEFSGGPGYISEFNSIVHNKTDFSAKFTTK